MLYPDDVRLARRPEVQELHSRLGSRHADTGGRSQVKPRPSTAEGASLKDDLAAELINQLSIVRFSNRKDENQASASSESKFDVVV